MDLITQGILGASWAQNARKFSVLPRAWFYGMLAGFLPDADVFIRSSLDPFLTVQFHRHFTHSLVFIPFGGMLIASLFIFRKKYRDQRFSICIASIAGLASHAILDAFTTYGTLLFWPFSDLRVAWDVIAIVDPLFSLPLIAAVIIAQRRKSQKIAFVGLLGCSIYMALCGWQSHRAANAQAALAKLRGHTIERARVLPSFANNVAWRSVYLHDGKIYIDAIRVPWLSAQASFVAGDISQQFVKFSDQEKYAKNQKFQHDLKLFIYFTDGWAGLNSKKLERGIEYIEDLRFGWLPYSEASIWGVTIDQKNPAQLLAFDQSSPRDLAKTRNSFAQVWQIVWGYHPRLRLLQPS
jgi:inner membrane protein